jgi:hypothetical protein
VQAGKVADAPDAVEGGARGVDLPEVLTHVQSVTGDDANATMAEALTEAVRLLLSVGLAVQVRPLVDELLALLKASRPLFAAHAPGEGEATANATSELPHEQG